MANGYLTYSLSRVHKELDTKPYGMHAMSSSCR